MMRGIYDNDDVMLKGDLNVLAYSIAILEQYNLTYPELLDRNM
jgi:hypothetical protein